MGNDIVHPGDRQSLPEPFGPVRSHGLHLEDRDSGGGLDVQSLLRVFKENRKLILAAAIAGLIGGLIITLLTPKMYRADVTLEVNPPKVEILNEKDGGEAPTATSWDFIATQVGLLRSRTLAERVAQELNLAGDESLVGKGGDPATRLRTATGIVAGGLTAELPEDGQLIRYSYVSTNPELAAKVANGIADSFINSSLQRRFDASNYARNFLLQQINKTRGELEKSERQLVTYAQAQGIINTGSGEAGSTTTDASSLQGGSLIALNGALAEATARRVMAEGAYRQARLAGGSAEVTASASGLRGSKAALEADYQDKLTLLKPDHPDMIALRSRIDELNRQIGSEQSRVASGKATNLLADYRAAAATENSLRSQVGQLRGSVLDLRGRSIQYNILQRDVDTNRGLYDALLQRYKQVGVAAGVGTSPVSIVDRAEVPGGPYKPNLQFNLLAGLIIGLVAGLGIALAMEFIHDTIKTRDDVRSKLMLACLGVIPKSNAGQPIVEELKDVSSVATEAYSAVLAALRFSTEQGAPKTLLLTSTMASEGKSSSALALAQNYARRGERVLLIDADLRRPVFKAQSNRHGLTKLLTNSESIRLHVLDTQYDNLYLLPCGPTPPNPADLLATPRFEAVLREAAQQFDRVIIDGPPVLGLADATLLATVVGSVVMIVESGKTRTRSARDALERLRLGGAHVLGAVLTKSVEEVGAYGYNRYKYGAIQQRSDELILISHQSDAG
ncbi:polysaccharide biosynthesis tyrosine autokinase [Sphingomonas sp.]|uniref:GumC family protein n=1 Tax=Sphingomonas sp. TaxID=28214 RepID=UPI00286AD076|nr:polysaccharide biosynthesis tyrosine autokinase [Sphingomonas sp.]